MGARRLRRHRFILHGDRALRVGGDYDQLARLAELAAAQIPFETQKGRPWGRPCNKHGADNGTRTRDPNLGKVMLYQLSHVRVQEEIIVVLHLNCKGKD